MMNIVLINICSGQVAILLLVFGDQLAEEDLHMSIDGAINMSNISNINNSKNFYGLNFGLGLHIKVNDHWQLNPQFRPLSQKGYSNAEPIIEIPSELSNDNTILKFNYIEVPIMMRYNISERMFASAGPQVSFLTSAKQITTGKYTNDREGTLELDAKKHFNTVTLGLPVELGYWLRFTNKKTTSVLKLVLFARYCPDLTSAFKNGNAKNSTLQFGLSFPVIKEHKNEQIF